MGKRNTFLPVIMVIVIVFLALIAIASGRSNAPDVATDTSYPHYVCTFSEYCAGPECSRDAVSFVIYTAHANGQPRLEAPGFGTRLTMTQTPTHRIYAVTGGAVTGEFIFYPDRAFDFAGTGSTNAGDEEHYATGRCERLVEP